MILFLPQLFFSFSAGTPELCQLLAKGQPACLRIVEQGLQVGTFQFVFFVCPRKVANTVFFFGYFSLEVVIKALAVPEFGQTSIQFFVDRLMLLLPAKG